MAKWRFDEDYGAPPWTYRHREPSLKEMIEESQALDDYRDRLKKEMKDKEDKEKNKKVQFPKFSFLETFSLFFVGGFVIGPFVALYVYMDLMIQLIQKAKVLAPLLK